MQLGGQKQPRDSRKIKIKGKSDDARHRNQMGFHLSDVEAALGIGGWCQGKGHE